MNPVNPTEVDTLVQDEFVPFRERLAEALSQKHPQLFSFVNALFNNQGNIFGMQVTENGRVIGEYALHFTGTKVTGVESGKLDAEVHHPFLGTVKPYVSIERQALEQMIADEPNLLKDYIPNAIKYLPDVTIKFLH